MEGAGVLGVGLALALSLKSLRVYDIGFWGKTQTAPTFKRGWQGVPHANASSLLRRGATSTAWALEAGPLAWKPPSPHQPSSAVSVWASLSTL